MIKLLKKFVGDSAGNMAITFALSSMALLAGAGAAIDFSTVSNSRAKLQSYADAAVLAAVISEETEIQKLRRVARKTVIANNTTDIQLRTRLTILPDGTYRVRVIATHDLLLMGMFSTNFSNVKVIAEAPPAGASQKLNIALVLDATFSMEGSKMSTLQTAATQLVEGLSGGADGDTMFSVIPFASYVQLPISYASEPWLNVEPDGDNCWNIIDEDNSVNCRNVGTGEDTHRVCDVLVTKVHCEPAVWEGCVNSRQSPWHKRKEYGSTQFQGFFSGDWCHDEILPLTTSISSAKTTIAEMSPAQDTYLPAGLAWGWRALSPEAPMTEANTADYEDRANVLLLMTDGENSRSLGGSESGLSGVYHWWEDQMEADNLTAELCASIKTDGITIYTVAFEVTDVNTIALLRNCASGNNFFYNAINASELTHAFSDIGNGLGGDIRLSR